MKDRLGTARHRRAAKRRARSSLISQAPSIAVGAFWLVPKEGLPPTLIASVHKKARAEARAKRRGNEHMKREASNRL